MTICPDAIHWRRSPVSSVVERIEKAGAGRPEKRPRARIFRRRCDSVDRQRGEGDSHALFSAGGSRRGRFAAVLPRLPTIGRQTLSWPSYGGAPGGGHHSRRDADQRTERRESRSGMGASLGRLAQGSEALDMQDARRRAAEVRIHGNADRGGRHAVLLHAVRSRVRAESARRHRALALRSEGEHGAGAADELPRREQLAGSAADRQTVRSPHHARHARRPHHRARRRNGSALRRFRQQRRGRSSTSA